MLHGNPMCKSEVSPNKVNPPSLWAWAENGEGSEGIFGLFVLKPMLYLGWVIFSPIKYKCDFYALLG